MSISILEAMAAAKPVVTTRVGEAPHLIEHRVNGFLYGPGDIDGMAAAIVQLARDESLRRSIGRAAAVRVAQRFTVEHMTRAYEKVYTDVLGGDNSTPTDARD
jgi:glycosyltransferase involved in cell wall biosynthesis